MRPSATFNKLIDLPVPMSVLDPPGSKTVDDIYAACERLQAHGVTITRPPRDGRMAFVRSPDQISIELLQAGEALPPREPWVSMPNVGRW